MKKAEQPAGTPLEVARTRYLLAWSEVEGAKEQLAAASRELAAATHLALGQVMTESPCSEAQAMEVIKRWGC